MVRKLLCLAVTVVFLVTGNTILHAQDLTIAVVQSPKTAKAGQDLGPLLRLLVANTGEGVQKDIALKIVLKNSPLCPKKGRPVAYSPTYYDGVLLRQGREIVTLEPGKSLTVTPHGAITIPGDTPVGRTYYLCAVIDTKKPQQKADESNVCACSPIKIIGAEEGPLVTRLAEKCLVPGGTLTILGRNFGPDAGTVTALSSSGLSLTLSVSSWNDSTVVARIPNDSRIQEGQQLTINIQRAGDPAPVSASGINIGICPAKKTTPAAEAGKTEFVPPFFYEKQ
ncbi:MAG: hypothetical protein EG828_04595 [Deltaproteobacteria bacterium]|nr:hypothetical protein [Deltaproteobacteria bacterium]